MKFSTRTEYGMRAVARLASHYGNKPYSLAKIAKEEGISLPYLERLFAQLKKAKIVGSKKGSKGGYFLIKSPSKVSIADVVKVLEGPIIPFRCVAKDQKMICRHERCLTKKVWIELQSQINKTLENIKLKDLVK